MDVNKAIKIFKVQKPSENKNSLDNYYYHCPKCSYRTSLTFNYRRHLTSSHPEELKDFNASAYDNPKSFKLYTHEDPTDYSLQKDNNTIQENYIKKQTNFEFKNIQINSWTNSLRELFIPNNHLNKFDIDLNQFYMHTNKLINSGSFSSSFLGEDKYNGIKVVILKTYYDYEEDIIKEKYILNKIKGLGNFPPLYDIMYDDDNIYLIEGHMGFDIESLFEICGKKFDIYTVMKIGIDIVNNLKILHESGYVHRDLKPDNLSFGPLCPENYKYKNTAGILDFGAAKFLYKKTGEINYNSNIVKRCGNRCFSSTNSLLDKDTLPYDDIESLFYILIYFFQGTLPWKVKKNGHKRLTINDIIDIRKNNDPHELCKGFPFEFIKLYEKIIQRKIDDKPNYEEIIECFNKILNEYIKNSNEDDIKLKWIRVFEEAKGKKRSKRINEKSNQTFCLFDRYGLILNKYLEIVG